MKQNRLSLQRTRNDSLSYIDSAFKPKANNVEIDIGNTTKHELSKTIGTILIRNGVPADCIQKLFDNDDFIDSLNNAVVHIDVFKEKNGEKFKHTWERPCTITEARFKDGKRADVFILDNQERVEFETDHKIEKHNSTTIKI